MGERYRTGESAGLGIRVTRRTLHSGPGTTQVLPLSPTWDTLSTTPFSDQSSTDPTPKSDRNGRPNHRRQGPVHPSTGTRGPGPSRGRSGHGMWTRRGRGRRRLPRFRRPPRGRRLGDARLAPLDRPLGVGLPQRRTEEGPRGPVGDRPTARPHTAESPLDDQHWSPIPTMGPVTQNPTLQSTQ